MIMWAWTSFKLVFDSGTIIKCAHLKCSIFSLNSLGKILVNVTYNLYQWVSKCGPQASSNNIIKKLFRNIHSWAPLRIISSVTLVSSDLCFSVSYRCAWCTLKFENQALSKANGQCHIFILFDFHKKIYNGPLLTLKILI